MPAPMLLKLRRCSAAVLVLLWGLLTVLAPLGHAGLHRDGPRCTTAGEHQPELAEATAEHAGCLVCAASKLPSQAAPPPSILAATHLPSSIPSISCRLLWRSVTAANARAPPPC
ncbi:MAG: hypothetical protein HUU35_04820 [Armatimonadetes bacterium]|nr:hypothetical protein [Armatimonadota bacterium]